MEYNRIYNEDCIAGLDRVPDGCVDMVMTDPPYKYLKEGWDEDFDEGALVAQLRRVVRPGGWAAVFGRGPSFYRLNAALEAAGFAFKEEVVWDKRYSNSPVQPLMRRHETCSLHVLGAGSVRRVRLPYAEVRECDPAAVAADVRRMMSALGNPSKLAAVRRWLDGGGCDYAPSEGARPLTVRGGLPKYDRAVQSAKAFADGLVEADVMSVPNWRNNRAGIHPTEKPVRLLERIISLCLPPGGDFLVLDPFSGSGSSCAAARNLGFRYLGFEKDEAFWRASVERMGML